MKKLLSLLRHIENNGLQYKIIHENEYLKIEIYKKDRYINWLTINDNKIYLGVDITGGFVVVEFRALLLYINGISEDFIVKYYEIN